MDSGDLSEKQIPHLLLELFVSAESGLLKVRRGDIEKTIHVLMGKPIFASSNDPQDRMGVLLNRRGIITEEQLEEGLRESREAEKRLGTVLVEKGLLEPEQLVTAVVDQVEEIIFSLFEWDEGTFSFETGDPVSDEVITLDLSAANIINEGVKRKYSPERVRTMLGPPSTVLRMNPNPAYQFTEFQMTSEQEEIFNAVDGRKTIQDVIAVGEKCGLSAAEAALFLCSLLLTKTVEADSGAPVPPSEGEGDAPARDAAPKPAPAPTPPPAGGDIRADILTMQRVFSGKNLYEKLGLTREAGKGEILTAYNKLLKKYKPEKLPPEFDDVREKARTVFSQIEEAYAVLFRDETRAKYDHDLEKKAESSLTDAEEAEVLEELAGEDPAHARKAFERAKVLFQEKRFADAVKAFEEAISLDQGVSEYHTGLALVHATEFPDHEPEMDKAEHHFMKAVSLNPTEGRNYYYLGVIYKSREEWKKAETYFRKVLELIPDHPDALRQIEWLSNMRA